MTEKKEIDGYAAQVDICSDEPMLVKEVACDSNKKKKERKTKLAHVESRSEMLSEMLSSAITWTPTKKRGIIVSELAFHSVYGSFGNTKGIDLGQSLSKFRQKFPLVAVSEYTSGTSVISDRDFKQYLRTRQRTISAQLSAYILKIVEEAQLTWNKVSRSGDNVIIKQQKYIVARTIKEYLCIV